MVEPRNFTPGTNGEIKPAAISPGTEMQKILAGEVKGRPGERGEKERERARELYEKVAVQIIRHGTGLL